MQKWQQFTFLVECWALSSQEEQISNQFFWIEVKGAEKKAKVDLIKGG